jgi:hypothetical protein
MNFVTGVPEARYRHWARDAKIANRLFEENRMTAESMLASLPTNRELLERVRRKENPTMRLRSTQE